MSELTAEGLDYERQLMLAKEAGSWDSFTSGAWYFDRLVCLKVAEPFAEPHRLELGCECDEEGFDEHWRITDRSCVFVDFYSRNDSGVPKLNKVLDALAQEQTQPATMSGSAEAFDVAHGESTLTDCRHVDGPDGQWVAVQGQYARLIERHAHPDEWRWATNPNFALPMVVAQRAGEVVGIIMPVSAVGSAAADGITRVLEAVS